MKKKLYFFEFSGYVTGNCSILVLLTIEEGKKLRFVKACHNLEANFLSVRYIFSFS